MSGISTSTGASTVALLTEGVDRNYLLLLCSIVSFASPSSRRAWIEMRKTQCQRQRGGEVALLTEGVDRNSVLRT